MFLPCSICGMVRHRLDSVNDCARQGYDLRIVCGNDACGHVTVASAVLMMQQIHSRRASLSLDHLGRRLKCSRCGTREPAVAPVLSDF